MNTKEEWLDLVNMVIDAVGEVGGERGGKVRGGVDKEVR